MSHRGTIQRSYLSARGERMWLVNWSLNRFGRPPPAGAIASELDFETGQAVTLTSDGQLVRLR